MYLEPLDFICFSRLRLLILPKLFNKITQNRYLSHCPLTLLITSSAANFDGTELCRVPIVGIDANNILAGHSIQCGQISDHNVSFVLIFTISTSSKEPCECVHPKVGNCCRPSPIELENFVRRTSGPSSIHCIGGTVRVNS